MNKKILFLGILSLAFAWTGPLPVLTHSAFYAHMIMHMLVVAIASPLIAMSFGCAAYEWTQKYPKLFAPIPASVGELIIVWGWHAPWFHHLARHSTWGLVAEQGSFLLAGLWVWVAAISRKQAGIIALLLTSMHMTFLGALLGLSARPLYQHHQSVGELSPLADQHLGGAIMLVVGGISYLSGGLWLTLQILKERKYEKLA